MLHYIQPNITLNPRDIKDRERGTMNAQYNKHTSFFKVLIKQSSVLLYVESPIILDLTCNVNSNFQFQQIARIISCNRGLVTQLSSYLYKLLNAV